MLSTNWSKAEKAFQKQLELNIKELGSVVMPDHWLDVVNAVNLLKPKSFLDIGCGVGTIYKIIQNISPNISYKGIDYAPAAIKVARDFWKYEGLNNSGAYTQRTWLELAKATTISGGYASTTFM